MEQARLGELIQQEYKKMVNYVRSQVNSASEMDAEDFVQDVLARMLEQADPALPLKNLAGYVYRALRNRVIDYYRTRKKQVALEAAESGETPGLQDILREARPDALAALDAQEMEGVLYRALEQLKPIERNVVVAHELEGIGFKELAQSWDMPVNTLISHKARGLANLRNQLIKKED
jgi:RNA polymerase sigma factor (sigma-70 family)